MKRVFMIKYCITKLGKHNRARPNCLWFCHSHCANHLWSLNWSKLKGPNSESTQKSYTSAAFCCQATTLGLKPSSEPFRSLFYSFCLV